MKSIEAAADTGGLTRREALLASGSAGAALGGLVVDTPAAATGRLPWVVRLDAVELSKAIHRPPGLLPRGDGRVPRPHRPDQSARQRDRVAAGPRRPDRPGPGARSAARARRVPRLHARLPARRQGPRAHGRPPHHPGIADLRRPRPHDGRDLRRAPQARGRDHHRQDEHAGVRARLADLQPVFGTTPNAYDQTRTAGGSSGGAAVALALRMVPVADGSDYDGLAAQPGGLEQRLRLPPLDRARPGRSHGEVFAQNQGYDGPMGRTRDRCRPAAVGHGRPRPARADVARAGPVASSPAPCAATSAAPGSRSLGDFGGYLPFEPGVLELCRSAFGAFERIGVEVVDALPAFDPARVWDSFTKLRYWLIGGRCSRSTTTRPSARR